MPNPRKFSLTCKNCGSAFSRSVTIDGVRKKLSPTRYCLTCSPWLGPGNKKRQLTKYKMVNGIEHRLCSRCDTFKPLIAEFFTFRPSGRVDFCKPCMAEKVRTEAREDKLRSIEYKGGKCHDCDGVFLPAVYDFHHLEPHEKEFAISRKMRKSWDRLRAELDKCVLLCANCHRTRHANQ
jgi:hypothetical protein